MLINLMFLMNLLDSSMLLEMTVMNKNKLKTNEQQQEEEVKK
jgi:hypothetical protein